MFTPFHIWVELMKKARRRKKDGGPYEARLYTFDDFYDLKSLAEELIRNRKKLENGTAVNWMMIKSLKFVKGRPDFIGVKMDYEENDYAYLRVRKPMGRGRPSFPVSLEQAYGSQFPISEEKKKDLLG